MSKKPVVFLAAVAAVLSVVRAADARVGDLIDNGKTVDMDITFVNAGGDIIGYTLPPGKCVAFCYEGSSVGNSCSSGPGATCKSSGGACFNTKPQRIVVDGIQYYPPPPGTTAMLKQHPEWKLLTEAYEHLFYEEIDGEFVRAAVFDDTWAAAREAFVSAHMQVYESPNGDRIELPPENVYCYETIEFDWQGNPKAVWAFATEPTVAVVIDGHIAHVRPRRLQRDGDSNGDRSDAHTTTEEATTPARPIGEPK